MKIDSNAMRRGAAKLWEHTAAAVALALIVAALFLGYHFGKPAPEPEPVADEPVESEEPVAPPMYTCSMHPSVRLPDRDAKCPICFMDLIEVTDDTGGEGSERRIVLNEAAVKRSEIETAIVARVFPTAEVRLFGKVGYDETSVVRMAAYFPGRLERLFLNYVGVTVAKGDHVAEIYSPDLLASFEELRQAIAAAGASEGGSDLIRRTANETLSATRDKLRLFGLTEEQVRAVEAGTFEGERVTIFSPTAGVVTHLAAREGDYVRTGDPILTVANLDRLWLDLEAYESQLPLLNWGQAVTFRVEARPGEQFRGHIAFIEPIIDDRTRTAAVRVAVDNSDRRLKPGMFATAVVRSRIGTGGAVLSDELAGRWVSPMHPTVVKDGPGQCDVCGMDLVPAESLGVVGDPTSVEEPLVIPRTAVLFTGVRSVVYVRVPDAEKPTYEGREVVLGPRAGDLYTVRWGLSEGEAVVVNGAFRVDSAMQLAAKPSMMTPGTETDDPSEASRAEAKTRVPDSFIFALKPVYATYLDAQESLARDDLEGFQQAARDLVIAVGLVRETGVTGEALGVWRRAAGRLRFSREAPSIEEARSRLETMTNAVIALERRFGHRGSVSWHVAYCPMAFDNKGAEWLQRGTEINNPYFGASMLRCGEIRSEFAPLPAQGDGR